MLTSGLSRRYTEFQKAIGFGLRALFVDHYDSFSFNLIELLKRSGVDVVEHIYWQSIDAFAASSFDFVVLSPGPKHPRDAIKSLDLISKIKGKIPILGVCLGFQLILEAEGFEIMRVPAPHHGAKKSIILNPHAKLTKDLPGRISVATYNSLGIKSDKFRAKESNFVEVATSEDGLVQAVESKTGPIIAGLQFHPESFLSEYSTELIKNFMRQIL